MLACLKYLKLISCWMVKTIIMHIWFEVLMVISIKLWTSGILCCVVLQLVTSIFEGPLASVISPGCGGHMFLQNLFICLKTMHHHVLEGHNQYHSKICCTCGYRSETQSDLRMLRKLHRAVMEVKLENPWFVPNPCATILNGFPVISLWL
jgi:hypothetical protein